jgi:hypothetical protein
MPTISRNDSYGMPKQLSLFDTIVTKQTQVKDRPAPGELNIGQRLREEITRVLRACPVDRIEIAARMSRLIGADITAAQLNCWSAESKQSHRFPAEYIPAFCRATSNNSILRLIAEPADCYVLEESDALLAELGEISQTRLALNRKERAVRKLYHQLQRGAHQ